MSSDYQSLTPKLRENLNMMAQNRLCQTTEEVKSLLELNEKQQVLSATTFLPDVLTFAKAKIETAEKIAADFNLFPSDGSDFHGKTKPHVHMGTGTGDLVIPMEFYHTLHEAHTRL